jgi:hypothetical protein
MVVLTILCLSHHPLAIYQNVRKTLADFINLILGKNINFSNYYIFLSGINTFSPLNPRDIPESKKFQKQSRELQKPEKAFFRPKMLRQLLRGSKSSGMEVFKKVPYSPTLKPAFLGPLIPDSHGVDFLF